MATAERCAPCVYAAFEKHRDGCPICLAAPRAADYCMTGLALLDIALGEAGRPAAPAPAPTNAMTRDLSKVTLTVLADELRRWTIVYRHSPTSADEVHPWGGVYGDEARKKIARRFTYMNHCVLSGVVSDWKPT